MPPNSPIARLGLVFTVLGVSGLLISAVAALPDLRHPPESNQHKQAVVRDQAQQLAQANKEMAEAIARLKSGTPVENTPCAPRDDACLADAAIKEAGYSTVSVDVAVDEDAAWSMASYASASVKALEEFIRHPTESTLGALPTYSILVGGVGLFFWLMYVPTLGLLISYVRHGSAVSNKRQTVPADPPEKTPNIHVPSIAGGAGVPWYRTSGANSAFIIGSVATKGYLPLILVTCLLLLTGDIYYKEQDSAGNRRTWNGANKAAAILILMVNAGFLVYYLVRS